MKILFIFAMFPIIQILFFIFCYTHSTFQVYFYFMLFLLQIHLLVLVDFWLNWMMSYKNTILVLILGFCIVPNSIWELAVDIKSAQVASCSKQVNKPISCNMTLRNSFTNRVLSMHINVSHMHKISPYINQHIQAEVVSSQNFAN